VDDQGRVKLSRKAALKEEGDKAAKTDAKPAGGTPENA
jgi:hypothetical protein